MIDNINFILKHIYTLTSFIYLYTSYILYNKQYYIGSLLYIVCTILSFLWSLKNINDSNHIICKIDVFVAKICIIYNIYNFINLNSNIKLQKINAIFLALFAVFFFNKKEYIINNNIKIYNKNYLRYLFRIIWRLLAFLVTILLYN